MTETKKVRKAAPKVEESVNAPVEQAPKVEANFDMAAYETTVFLTLDKERRNGQRLTDEENVKLAAAEKIAFNNPGRKATKTDTYRVSMRTVRLVKGLPTPESIISLFPKHGQEKLFS